MVNNKEPLVSIIIPSYNHAEYIGTAIWSALNQSYKSIEVIIIDNFSQDATNKIIEKILKDNVNISVYKIRNEGVISASRNLGAKYARGEWLAFLDSDDFWRPNKIETCINHALKSNCDLVCHAEEWVFEEAKRSIDKQYGPKKLAQYKKLLYRGNCISTSAVILRRSKFDEAGGFSVNRNYAGVEDYDLWLRLSKNEISIEFIEEILGSYRIHKSNISGQLKRQLLAEANVIADHHKRLRNSFALKFLYIKRLSVLNAKFFLKKIIRKLNVYQI